MVVLLKSMGVDFSWLLMSLLRLKWIILSLEEKINKSGCGSRLPHPHWFQLSFPSK